MYHIFKCKDGYFYVDGSMQSMLVQDLPDFTGPIELDNIPTLARKSVSELAEYFKSTHFCSIKKLAELKQLYPEHFI